MFGHKTYPNFRDFVVLNFLNADLLAHCSCLGVFETRSNIQKSVEPVENLKKSCARVL